jgi:hypothetical protein
MISDGVKLVIGGLIICVLIAVFSAVSRGNDIFVGTNKGVWKVSVVDDEPKVQLVWALPTGSVLVWPGVTKPPSPDPAPSDLSKKVESISEGLLKNQLEARAVLSLVEIFNRPNADLSKFKTGMTRAVDLLSSQSLFPDNKFKEWNQRVLSELPQTVTKDHIAQISLGIRSAFNLPARSAITGSTTQANPPNVERVDWVQLIQIIRMIIELLRDLGIFTG